MAEDPVLGLAQAIIMIGPEHAPDGLLGASTWEALFRNIRSIAPAIAANSLQVRQWLKNCGPGGGATVPDAFRG